jgi:hypothetical protein
MPATDTTDVPRIVAHTREVYLRQNEARIRSDAARLAKSDPSIKRHLDAVEMAEDLGDYHETVINHFRDKKLNHRIPPHERYRDQTFQLKLHHLDQLANLIL